MKKNILRTLLFVSVLLLVIYALQYAIDAIYKKRAKDKYALVYNHQADPDMMIYGASTALKEFDTHIIKNITGYSCYNMGYDGMFFLQYYPTAKEHLSYQKNCKMVIIVCNVFLGKDWVIMAPNFFYAYYNNNTLYNSFREIMPREMTLARYLPGYKLTLLNKAFYREIAYPLKSIDTNYGYEPILESGNDFKDVKPFREPCDSSVVSKLKSLLNDISNSGLKAVLVMTPIYEKGHELILNADSIISVYSTLADTSRNIYFLDYSKDSLSKSAQYFYTYTHLNKKGSELFSAALSTDLLRIKARR